MEEHHQGTPHSMWDLVATVLSVWAPVEDWEIMDRSQDNTEKALQELSSHLSDTMPCTRRRQWQPTPVLLPGKFHGWRSLGGCSPWGR